MKSLNQNRLTAWDLIERLILKVFRGSPHQAASLMIYTFACRSFRSGQAGAWANIQRSPQVLKRPATIAHSESTGDRRQSITVPTENRSQAIYGLVSPVRPQAEQEQIWWPTTQRQNRGECDDDHEETQAEFIEIGVVVWIIFAHAGALRHYAHRCETRGQSPWLKVSGGIGFSRQNFQRLDRQAIQTTAKFRRFGL